MKKSPTIKQLRYFIALEQLLHFRKAAETCYVSQSAFSVAIRELESILGAQLADRNNKNVTITSIGKDVAIQARLVLRDLEVLVELTERNQSPLAGRLKLGVIPTITPFLLPQILPRLRKEFPDLKLFLYEDLTQRIYERLMGGDLDLILIAVPYDLRNIETMPLFKDPFYFAYSRGSKLIDQNHYEIEDLPSESILLLEDGHCLRDHALSACKISNRNKVSKVTANSLLTLIQMVDADLGVTFLPEMVVKSSLLKNTQVKTLNLPTQNYRELGLVWRQGSTRSNEFELLGNFICKQHAAS